MSGLIKESQAQKSPSGAKRSPAAGVARHDLGPLRSFSK